MIDKREKQKIFLTLPIIVFCLLNLILFFVDLKFRLIEIISYAGIIFLSIQIVLLFLFFYQLKYKKYFIMILVVVILLINIFYFQYEYFDDVSVGLKSIQKGIKYPETKEKYYCNTDLDCVKSITDPYLPNVCVNKNWYEKNKREVGIQCENKIEISCLCQKNKCIRSDLKKGGC